ncbi:flagellar biosynthesis protein FliS [Methylophaga lonarensis MPL]|uniref:Flagellar secretion chaperone FliS n=1 Tax=Methylophaga lonarensis MPL TaxID=1286106 RepID=M7PKA3_9GAMM|nr:flagellar export chaperone FliS [Methylophaga lonarensis]EMR14285.1 flagellar biosynthesis protein FliS [Methylophaga lonarensis MPL]
MNASLATQQYRQNHIHGGVESASPHRLVQMLMEGVVERIINARRFMGQGNVAQKGEQISWAIAIIDNLRACLNPQAGGEMAVNLRELYTYMEQRLLEANLKNDDSILDEVAQLMLEIKAGWDAIPTELHDNRDA